MCWDPASFQAQKDVPRFPEGRPGGSVDSSALRQGRSHTSWWGPGGQVRFSSREERRSADVRPGSLCGGCLRSSVSGADPQTGCSRARLPCVLTAGGCGNAAFQTKRVKYTPDSGNFVLKKRS